MEARAGTQQHAKQIDGWHRSNWLRLVNHPVPSLASAWWPAQRPRSPTREGARPRNRAMASQMPTSVHSLADATRQPNENVDALIRHSKATSDELEAQLAVARARRDAWRELVEHRWQLSTPSGSAGSNKPGPRPRGHDTGSGQRHRPRGRARRQALLGACHRVRVPEEDRPRL